MQNRSTEQAGSSANTYNNVADMPELPPELLNWNENRIQEMSGSPTNTYSEDGFSVDGATGQLVRRNQNNQIQRSAFDTSNQPGWQDLVTQAPSTWPQQQATTDDEEDLDRKAEAAKKDAMSRRPPKSIPPFIQKLSR